MSKCVFQDLLSLPQLKLVKAVDVRWLSHDKAVSTLRKAFAAVIISLEREAVERHDVTASGLAKYMKSVNFIASLAMLQDILPVLTILSTSFQVEIKALLL